MPNEREVKEAARRARNPEPVCSATSSPCECLAGGGCKALQPILDPPAVEAVRWLRSALIYLDAAKFALDSALGGEELLVRKYPAPEIREVRRKVVTAIALIDEIGGEL